VCTGHTHALTGLVTGLAAGEFVLHLPLPQTAGLALLTAGAAVLPDVDHPDSTLAHSFGFLTRAVAEIIGKVSGGHRHGTHSIAGVAVFTLAAWLGVYYRHDWAGRIGLGVLLAVVIASGLIALRIGKGRRWHRVLRGHRSDALAIAAAAGMTFFGTGLALVAVAMGLGCATHIFAGDSFTDQGCPWGWPLSQRHFRWVPEPIAFTTNTKPEAVFAAAFGLAFLVLVARGVTVALDPAAWAHLIQYA
jgi:membrane-bound metal-dependent hydrolase YbcI (DUF457 family)